MKGTGMNGITLEDFVETIFDVEGRQGVVNLGRATEGYGEAWPIQRGSPNKNYFCVSTVEAQKPLRRRLIDVRQACVFVLDDIGTKSKGPTLQPSYKLTTSIKEGIENEQWGYLIDPYDVSTPEGRAYYDACTKAAGAAGICDPGMRGAQRIARTVGSLHKTGFVARLTEWEPERVWLLPDLMAELGLEPEKFLEVMLPIDLSSTELEDVRDPVLWWLIENKVTTGRISGDWVEVACPWGNEHSDGRPFSGYSPKSFGHVGAQWKCLHGHCQHRRTKDFLDWVQEAGGPSLDEVVIKPAERAVLAEALKDSAPFARALSYISTAGSREELVEKIKPMLGLTPEQSEDLAKEVKKKFRMPIAEARKLTETAEQKATRKADAAAQRKQMVGEKIDVGYIGNRVDAIAEELAATFDNVFSRGGTVMRVQHGVAVSVTREWMMCEATRKCFFTTETGVPIDCPGNLSAALVRGTVADKYPVLKGIARTPYLIGDRVHSERGYNPETGIWLETDMELPEIEVGLWQESFARLLDLVAEFPFEDDKDRSAWLADLLGAVARPTLPTMPGTIYTASTPGTGKTLLMELVNLIAYGESALGSWPTTEEERQKVILAGMRSSPYLAFDNVRSGAKLRSEALTQLITSEHYRGRLLGVSESVSIPNHTRVVLTGNNINAEGDMARRFLTIRLDAQMADPTQRRFRIYDIRQHVIDNRARLLAECLVLLLYGMQTPLADAPAPLASFTRWSRVVRETVISLGLPDPVLTVNIESEDLDLLDEAFEQIEEAMAAYPKWKATMLVEQCTLRPDLHAALADADCIDPKNVKEVGYWLRTNRGRRAGGRILETVGGESKSKNAKMWRVRKINEGV